MKRRWSLGVIVAIAVAIAVAVSVGEARAPTVASARTPTEVTLALRADGISLHIVYGALAVTLSS